MKGRKHHHMPQHGRHHSPSGEHDVKGHPHRHHSLGHTAKAAGFKTGGKIVGKIGGKVAKHKAGGFKRGGRMSPSSPLSGATVKEKGFVGDSIPKEDEGGTGKDSR